MKNPIALAAIVSFSASLALAKTASEQALQFVPKGKIVQEKPDEIKVQTTGGGIVEVEFANNGDFEEASGNSVDQDTFIPPHGLVPLATAAQAVKGTGKSLSGKWSLDKSLMSGWHYEFEGYENGNEMEYTVDAKTGKYVSAKVD